MILVVGATGLLGGDITERLRGRGERVRALVRGTSNPARVCALEKMGAELATGDLTEPASLSAACRGARAVISTATGVFPRAPHDSIAGVDRDGHLALVDAAVDAEVGHLVHISFSGNVRTDDPLTAAKRAVERRLRASDRAYTILRCEPFMESWLGAPFGFDLAAGAVRVVGPGEAPVSWVARGDVAEFAVRSIGGPAARDATIELGGPQALSQLDVVHIAEDIGGRPIAVEHVPEKVLRQQLATARTPTERVFAELMLHLLRGDVVDTTAAAGRLGVELTPVRDYVRSVVAGKPSIGSQ